VRSVEIVVMVVLGGLGSITGVTLAALLLTGSQEALRSPNVAFGTALALVVFAAALSYPRYRERAKRAFGEMQPRSWSWLLAWARWPLVTLIGLFLVWKFEGDWLEANAPSLRYILFALILIVLMLLRPQGLLGRAELSLSTFRRRSSAPNRPVEAADQGVSGTL
jgi:branched-chain amino acid transport system permease protein